MPTPTLITDLSTTAGSNFPDGGQSPTVLDDVQRAHAAFIAQLNIGSHVPNATAKTTPVDADLVPINDSAASNVLKKLTWANLKATLKTYFDTLYMAVGGDIGAATATTPAASDNDTSVATTAWVQGELTSQAVKLTGTQTIAGVKTFSSMPILPTQSMVRLNTANGYGSTNTKIRRFTTTVTSQGADITYADSAANGGSFTINTSGVYAISYQENLSAADVLGISLNSSQLTTSIATITAADVLQMTTQWTANVPDSTSWTGYLAAGSVIRAHTSGAAAGSGPVAQFTIARIA